MVNRFQTDQELKSKMVALIDAAAAVDAFLRAQGLLPLAQEVSLSTSEICIRVLTDPEAFGLLFSAKMLNELSKQERANLAYLRRAGLQELAEHRARRAAGQDLN